MAASTTWPTVARYLSTRRLGVSHEVRQRPGTETATAADVYCTCAGWRFSRLVPKTCGHVERWLTRDQYEGAPPPVSQTRHLLAQAGKLAQFTAHQLSVLEAVFESRLVRGRAATPGAAQRNAPRIGGVREIVFEE